MSNTTKTLNTKNIKKDLYKSIPQIQIDTINEEIIKNTFSINDTGSVVCSKVYNNPIIKAWLFQQIENNKLFNNIYQYIQYVIKDITLPLCPTCNKVLTYKQYNIGTVFCSNTCKGKSIDVKKKRKNTLMDNYGVTNSYNCPHIKQDFIDKYGVDNPGLVPEFRLKQQQTCLEKYGHQNALVTEPIKQKVIKNRMKKFGVKFNTQIPYVINKVIQTRLLNTYNKICERYKDKYVPMFDADQYIGSGYKYKWKCVLCNTEFYSYYDDGYIKSKCPNCYPKQIIYFSKGERAIADICKQYYDILTNDRIIIKPYELDIVIPKLNKAIEFNGIYWHNDNFKDSSYHLDKLNKCLNNSYQLIQILDYEWNTKQTQCEILIKQFINVLPTIPDDFNVEIVDNLDAIKFIDQYSLIQQYGQNNCGFRINNQFKTVISFDIDDNNIYINQITSLFNLKQQIPIIIDFFDKNYNNFNIILIINKRFDYLDNWIENHFEVIYQQIPQICYNQKGNIVYDAGSWILQLII